MESLPVEAESRNSSRFARDSGIQARALMDFLPIALPEPARRLFTLIILLCINAFLGYFEPLEP